MNILTKKISEKEPAAIQILSMDKECMRIENDGRVFWLRDGKMVQAVMDEDLAMAFVVSIEAVSGLKYQSLMEKIRKEAERRGIQRALDAAEGIKDKEPSENVVADIAAHNYNLGLADVRAAIRKAMGV